MCRVVLGGSSFVLSAQPLTSVSLLCPHPPFPIRVPLQALGGFMQRGKKKIPPAFPHCKSLEPLGTGRNTKYRGRVW